MKNKLLIYSQEYDIIHHKCIIDKNDLEAYIQNHVKEFTKDSSKRTVLFDYISHEVRWDQSKVVIKYLQHAYTVLNSTYKEQDYYDGFDFIILDKMPEWKAQAKPLCVKIKESLPYYKAPSETTSKPKLIVLNNTEFSQLQIQSVSKIGVTPRYVDVSAEGYSEAPWLPTQRVWAKNEYLPIEMHLLSTMDQIKEIRSVFSASTDSLNPNTRRKPEVLKIVNGDQTFILDGFIRDLTYTAQIEYPDYIEIVISFVVNNITVEK